MDEKDYIEDIDEYCMYVHVSSTLHIHQYQTMKKFTNQSNHTYIKNSTQQLLIHQQNI